MQSSGPYSTMSGPGISPGDNADWLRNLMNPAISSTTTPAQRLQGQASAQAGQSGDVGTFLFGGPNQRGLFGGGYYQANPLSFLIPEADTMNRRYGQAASWSQNALNPNAPGSTQYGQNELLNQLLAQAMGRGGPSVADKQLAQTTDANIANAYAMGAANPRANAKMVADQVAGINQQAAGQAGLQRAQEQLGAQQLAQQGYGQAVDQQGQQFLGSLIGQGGLNTAQAQGLQNYEQMQANAFNSQPSPLQSLASVGGGIASAMLPFLAYGGPVIPGRASVGGAIDSTRNDTVPILASPGEVVLPRSVTLAKDAPARAQAFVEAIRRAHGLRRAA